MFSHLYRINDNTASFACRLEGKEKRVRGAQTAKKKPKKKQKERKNHKKSNVNTS